MDEPDLPHHGPDKPRKTGRRARMWIVVGIVVATTLVVAGMAVVALFVIGMQSWAANK